MNTEVTEVRNDLPAVQQETINPLSIIQGAIQSGIGADELGKLMDLQERYEASQARRRFSAALAQFQADCPTIIKSRQADRYNYAPFDEIMRTIRPHLAANGLSVRFSTTTESGIITAVCTVNHSDGHSESSEFSAPIDPNMRVNETQKAGSANSYAKRYCVINALNLSTSDEYDDDGSKAGTQMISEDQAGHIREWIDKLEIDEPAYLRVIGVGFVEDIPLASFGLAMQLIERKRKAVEK